MLRCSLCEYICSELGELGFTGARPCLCGGDWPPEEIRLKSHNSEQYYIVHHERMYVFQKNVTGPRSVRRGGGKQRGGSCQFWAPAKFWALMNMSSSFSWSGQVMSCLHTRNGRHRGMSNFSRVALLGFESRSVQLQNPHAFTTPGASWSFGSCGTWARLWGTDRVTWWSVPSTRSVTWRPGS